MSRHDSIVSGSARQQLWLHANRDIPFDPTPHYGPAETQPFLPLTRSMLWQVPVIALTLCVVIVGWMVVL